MDITALSGSLSQTQLMTNVGATVLSMNLELIENSGTELLKMMESSVSPNLGQNIDIKV